MKVIISDLAIKKLQTYSLQEGDVFRLSTKFSGGCSYTYDFDFMIDFPKEEDVAYDNQGVTVYLDKQTRDHINENLKIDYEEGKGFRLVGASQIYAFYLSLKRKGPEKA